MTTPQDRLRKHADERRMLTADISNVVNMLDDSEKNVEELLRENGELQEDIARLKEQLAGQRPPDVIPSPNRSLEKVTLTEALKGGESLTRKHIVARPGEDAVILQLYQETKGGLEIAESIIDYEPNSSGDYGLHSVNSNADIKLINSVIRRKNMPVGSNGKVALSPHQNQSAIKAEGIRSLLLDTCLVLGGTGMEVRSSSQYDCDFVKVQNCIIALMSAFSTKNPQQGWSIQGLSNPRTFAEMIIQDTLIWNDELNGHAISDGISAIGLLKFVISNVMMDGLGNGASSASVQAEKCAFITYLMSFIKNAHCNGFAASACKNVNWRELWYYSGHDAISIGGRPKATSRVSARENGDSRGGLQAYLVQDPNGIDIERWNFQNLGILDAPGAYYEVSENIGKHFEEVKSALLMAINKVDEAAVKENNKYSIYDEFGFLGDLRNELAVPLMGAFEKSSAMDVDKASSRT